MTRNINNASALLPGGYHDRKSSHGMFATMAARNMVNNNNNN
jgi:hypothetical protein